MLGEKEQLQLRKPPYLPAGAYLEGGFSFIFAPRRAGML